MIETQIEMLKIGVMNGAKMGNPDLRNLKMKSRRGCAFRAKPSCSVSGMRSGSWSEGLGFEIECNSGGSGSE